MSKYAAVTPLLWLGQPPALADRPALDSPMRVVECVFFYGERVWVEDPEVAYKALAMLMILNGQTDVERRARHAVDSARNGAPVGYGLDGIRTD